MKNDQACYIINDGKPKRRSVQQAAPTEYGPFGDNIQSNNIYIIKIGVLLDIEQINK